MFMISWSIAGADSRMDDASDTFMWINKCVNAQLDFCCG